MRTFVKLVMAPIAVAAAGTAGLAGVPGAAGASPAACPTGPVAYVGPTATVSGQETITPVNALTGTADPKIKIAGGPACSP